MQEGGQVCLCGGIEGRGGGQRDVSLEDCGLIDVEM